MSHHPASSRRSRLGLPVALLVTASAAALGLTPAPAQAYTTRPEIVVTRSFSASTVVPGQVVSVSLTAEIGAIGSDPIRGLFITDHVPDGLTPTDGALYVDGSGTTARREAELSGTIYSGCTSERWVLETPPAWSENHPLGAGATVVVTYNVTVPGNASPGVLSFPGFTWIGMIAASGDAGDHFGYEDTAATLTVEAAGTDDDGDRMPNDWESDHGLDPQDPADATDDDDGDGLNNLAEYQNGCDPQNSDSDGDTMPDGWEVAGGLDPLRVDTELDADGDGYSNLTEYQAGSDPALSSSTPAQGLPLFEDFEDGDDTASPTWEHWSGTWAVSAGEYHQTELQDNRLSVVGDVGWTDYRVEVRVRLAGNTSSGSGPMFRVQDRDNYYLFEVDAGSSSAVVWKRAVGQWTELGSGPLTTAPTANTWFDLAVEVEGSSIRGYLDDNLVVELSDGALSHGRVGLNTGDEAWFDDVQVALLGQPGNLLPSASASAEPSSGTAPLAVVFSGTGSDPDGSIAAFAWDFGDGEVSTEANPTHRYALPGSYAARLTVTDDQGASASASVTILVFDSAGGPDGGSSEGGSASDPRGELGPADGCACAAQGGAQLHLLLGLALIAVLAWRRRDAGKN